MAEMKPVKPFVRCIDYWPIPIPERSLAAYKQLIQEGQIQKHHVVYSRTTKTTTVEYYSIAPHEWIKEELRKRADAIK